MIFFHWRERWRSEVWPLLLRATLTCSTWSCCQSPLPTRCSARKNGALSTWMFRHGDAIDQTAPFASPCVVQYLFIDWSFPLWILKSAKLPRKTFFGDCEKVAVGLTTPTVTHMFKEIYKLGNSATTGQRCLRRRYNP
jgi:hypothetical protein